VYAGHGVYKERMVEECRSGDIAECIRVFDRNPNKEWPLNVKNVVLAGRPFLRMPFVVDDIERGQHMKDGASPVTWYLCFGSVREQRDVLLYEILPFLKEMNAEGGDILWCPSTEKVEGADYRQDALEVLDAYEKLEEFNVFHKTEFKLGLAKIWLPRGKEFERERVYCCRLGAALDVIGFHYIQCRVLPLGIFTTTEDRQRGTEAVDVQHHDDMLFREDAYLNTSGYKLRDYFYRTVRQRIRKLLRDEGVVPKDWNQARAAGLIRTPGNKGQKPFEAPRGSPLKEMIQERAGIRVEFSQDKTKRKDLPQLGAMKFGMFNYTSENVRPQDLTRTARITLGNGVRETTIPPNYVAFPEEAMTRSAQERGLLQDKDTVRIPKPVAVCQGIVRQAMTIPRPKIQAVAITPTTVPKEDWMKKELMELAKLQRIERELYAEPTTLIGAIQELNERNRGTAVLNRSDSSVEFVCEVKGNPERERKPVVKLTPPMVNEVVMPVQQVLETVRQVVEPVRQVYEPVRRVLEPADRPVDVLDMGDGSDDPDRDRIILQRIKIQLEMDRLAKFEAEYALKMENKRRMR